MNEIINVEFHLMKDRIHHITNYNIIGIVQEHPNLKSGKKKKKKGGKKIRQFTVNQEYVLQMKLNVLARSNVHHLKYGD